MSMFLAIILLGIFLLLMVGAVIGVASTLGKRHHHAEKGHSRKDHAKKKSHKH